MTVVSAGAAIGLGLASSSLASSCRWCGSNGIDDSMRSALRRNDPGPAGVVSDVVVGAAPFAGLGLLALAAHDEGHADQIPLDALLVAEATTVAMLASSVTKVTLARRRPSVSALSVEEGALSTSSSDKTSFVSGHATFAFSLVTSAGTIAQMRGYRMAPLVWGVGVPLALATSYFQLAGDREHFTDVLGGMLVGALVGVGLPLLFHAPVTNKVMVSAAPIVGGQMLTVTFRSPL